MQRASRACCALPAERSSLQARGQRALLACCASPAERLAPPFQHWPLPVDRWVPRCHQWALPRGRSEAPCQQWALPPPAVQPALAASHAALQRPAVARRAQTACAAAAQERARPGLRCAAAPAVAPLPPEAAQAWMAAAAERASPQVLARGAPVWARSAPACSGAAPATAKASFTPLPHPSMCLPLAYFYPNHVTVTA